MKHRHLTRLRACREELGKHGSVVLFAGREHDALARSSATLAGKQLGLCIATRRLNDALVIGYDKRRRHEAYVRAALLTE